MEPRDYLPTQEEKMVERHEYIPTQEEKMVERHEYIPTQEEKMVEPHGYLPTPGEKKVERPEFCLHDQSPAQGENVEHLESREDLHPRLSRTRPDAGLERMPCSSARNPDGAGALVSAPLDLRDGPRATPARPVPPPTAH